MVVNQAANDTRDQRQILIPVSQIPHEIKRFFEHKKTKIVEKIHGGPAISPSDLQTINVLIRTALIIFMICAICAIFFLIFMGVQQILDSRRRSQYRKAQMVERHRQAYFHQDRLNNPPPRQAPSDSTFSNEPRFEPPPVRAHDPLFKKCSYSASIKVQKDTRQTASVPSAPQRQDSVTSNGSSTDFSQHFQDEIQINVESPHELSDYYGRHQPGLSVVGLNPNENDRSFSLYEEMPPPPPPPVEPFDRSEPPTLRAKGPWEQSKATRF